jgi:hypothetical protein
MRKLIDMMRLDQTRHVACASSCILMRTSLEEGIKLHRFAGIFPEQFFHRASAAPRKMLPGPAGFPFGLAGAPSC